MDARLRAIEQLIKDAIDPRPQPVPAQPPDSLDVTMKATIQKSKDDRLMQIQYKFESMIAPLCASELWRNFTSICRVAVQFVEDHAVDIASIIGGAMVGQLKFTTAVNLVWALFKDLTMELIGGVVEDQHTIPFKPLKNKTLLIENKTEQLIELPKKKTRLARVSSLRFR